MPEKVVQFSRWKLLNGKFVFHLQISRLYHQCLRGLSAARLPSVPSCFNKKWQLIRVSFLGKAMHIIDLNQIDSP